jgi:hypothetical protein
MDHLSEDEELEITRNLERLRRGQDQQKKRATHATVQAKYRARLEKNAAPARTDYAIVALALVLQAIVKNPEHGTVRLLREAMEEELVTAGFDREQIRIRLGGMLEDCERDLDKWRHDRAWIRAHKARVAKATAK